MDSSYDPSLSQTAERKYVKVYNTDTEDFEEEIVPKHIIEGEYRF
jgi:hypothetical protein